MKNLSAFALMLALGLAAAPAWAQKPTNATFEKWCAPCHRAGMYMAGTVGLEAKYHGQRPALLEERTDLTADYVKTIVRNGTMSMPPFRKTEITDRELDALADYLGKGK